MHGQERASGTLNVQFELSRGMFPGVMLAEVLAMNLV
jgi:hypothetical protein